MTKNYFALPLAFVAALALARTAPVTAQGRRIWKPCGSFTRAPSISNIWWAPRYNPEP